MFFVIPTGHSDAVVRRIPWVTIVIAALCLLVQVWSSLGPSDQEIGRVMLEREGVEHHILYEYGLLEAPVDEQRAFLAAFHDGEQGEPDDELRDEYQAVLTQGAHVDEQSPLLLMGYRPATDGPLRMLTSAFVHDGWIHLLGNLLFLYLVGCNLEDRWTRGGFLAFYLLGALVAAASYGLMHRGSPIPLIGASGAVSAAMGGFLVVLGAAKIRFFYLLWIFIHFRTGSFHSPAYVALPIWFVLQLLNAGLEGAGAGGGVAYSAHVGGFVFGAAVGVAMRMSGWDRKLDERDDEVIYDAERDIGHLPNIHERIRHEPGSPQLLDDVQTYLLRSARLDQAGEVLHIHHLVAERGDLTLDDRCLLSIMQAAAQLGESELAVATVGTLMQVHPHSSLIPRALWDAAQVQRTAGREDLANKTLDNLVRLFPDDPFAQQARQLRT